jgi:hypothetical protein
MQPLSRFWPLPGRTHQAAYTAAPALRNGGLPNCGGACLPCRGSRIIGGTGRIDAGLIHPDGVFSHNKDRSGKIQRALKMNTVNRGGAGALTIAIALAVLLTAVTSASAQRRRQAVGDEAWITYKNERFGYSLYYPSKIFLPGELPDNGGGQTFTTEDDSAKIVVFATLNSEKFSPAEYRKTILEEFGGYDRMDYSPTGQTWFVLSGFRGENIYYQKVMFSCGGRVINALSITFPTVDKPFYEPLIEAMEDRFRPGRGVESPPGC